MVPLMFKKKRRTRAYRISLVIFFAVIAFLALGKYNNVQAAVLLFDEGTGLRNNGFGNWNGTVGILFKVGETPLRVTSLGLWDGPNDSGGEGDGLELATEVGLWQNSVTLLASVSIGTVGAGSLVDGSNAYCLYESLTTPVILSANTEYRVGARYTSGGNAFTNNPKVSATGHFNSEVTVLAGVYNTDGANLNWPGDQDPNNYFGSATMQFSEVPIPGGVWILGSGFIGLVGLRRTFRK